MERISSREGKGISDDCVASVLKCYRRLIDDFPLLCGDRLSLVQFRNVEFPKVHSFYDQIFLYVFEYDSAQCLGESRPNAIDILHRLTVKLTHFRALLYLPLVEFLQIGLPQLSVLVGPNDLNCL